MLSLTSNADDPMKVPSLNSPTSFVVEQTVATPPRAKTLTLDAKTGHILLITAEYGPPPAPAAPAPGAAPAGGPGGPGGPGGFRGPRSPMVPGSFSIVVVGK